MSRDPIQFPIPTIVAVNVIKIVRVFNKKIIVLFNIALYLCVLERRYLLTSKQP